MFFVFSSALSWTKSSFFPPAILDLIILDSFLGLSTREIGPTFVQTRIVNFYIRSFKWTFDRRKNFLIFENELRTPNVGSNRMCNYMHTCNEYSFLIRKMITASVANLSRNGYFTPSCRGFGTAVNYVLRPFRESERSSHRARRPAMWLTLHLKFTEACHAFSSDLVSFNVS